MTPAYRLKGLGWFAGCVVVTLGFYLVSLQVAAERNRLNVVNAKIRSAERDIRALETEFDTRANLTQLERWNGDTLALVAPVASQFVRSEAQLASISFTPGAPGAPEVKTAQLVVPSLPDFAAKAATPAPIPAIVEPAPAPRPHLIQVAQTTLKAPVFERPQIIKAAMLTTVVPAKPAPSAKKAQAMAMLDDTLLSDSTLGDLLSGARRENGRRR